MRWIERLDLFDSYQTALRCEHGAGYASRVGGPLMSAVSKALMQLREEMQAKIDELARDLARERAARAVAIEPGVGFVAPIGCDDRHLWKIVSRSKAGNELSCQHCRAKYFHRFG